MTAFRKITGQAQRAARGLKVRSALNPALWLSAVLAPVCFMAAWTFSDHPFLLYALVVTGIVTILIACGAYTYLLVSEPDRLQSESYQIRREALSIVKSGSVEVETTSLDQLTTETANVIEQKSEGVDGKQN